MKALVIGLVAAIALAGGASARQTQTKPDPAKPDQPKQEQSKPDAKPSTKDVTGKWNMSVEMQDGAHTSTIDLKLDGKKVTGTVNSELGVAPLTGEFADGKITFTLSLEGPNGTLQFGFSGTMKDDGTMAGGMTMGETGGIPWSAARVKDK